MLPLPTSESIAMVETFPVTMIRPPPVAPTVLSMFSAPPPVI
jgi:hypothetical protein